MKEKNDNIFYGRNPVKEALRSNKVKKVYLLNNFNDDEILELIKKNKVLVTNITMEKMNSIANGVHQGIAAELKDIEYFSLDSLIGFSKKQERPLIVILDGINDPQNFGAIMRSCDVFNVTGIVISKHNQVPLNATVGKTSAGAINYVPVALVNNLNQAIAKLKENGFWIVSSDGSAKQSYADLKYDFNVALVIGSEGQGVSSLVLKNSDYIVKIPQQGHVNSLNASVAAGILLSKIRE